MGFEVVPLGDSPHSLTNSEPVVDPEPSVFVVFAFELILWGLCLFFNL